MTTTNPPFRVIVNADDFGMSVWATDQIVACIDAGQVTSTTVMANGPDLGRALGLAADRPRASFGVHLNATQLTTVELMVHPGHPEYAEETEILLDGWQRHVERPISLISFDQLGA